MILFIIQPAKKRLCIAGAAPGNWNSPSAECYNVHRIIYGVASE